MKKLYCNGKKDYCPHFDGENPTICSDFNCGYFDGSGCKITEEKFTNYDRIQNMSIEEMAEFMRKMLDCVSCQNKMMNNNNPLGRERCNDTDFYKMCDGDYTKCIEVCKKWLESEAE